MSALGRCLLQCATDAEARVMVGNLQTWQLVPTGELDRALQSGGVTEYPYKSYLNITLPLRLVAGVGSTAE